MVPVSILVVEDNLNNLDMLKRRLESRGYQVLSASDGIEAIGNTKLHQPQLILMDMNLPKVSGWDATVAIKSDPDCARIPIIALTASALVEDQTRALLCGCSAFHSKPVDMDLLVRQIQQFTAHKP